jgi:hypothetical protein
VSRDATALSLSNTIVRFGVVGGVDLVEAGVRVETRESTQACRRARAKAFRGSPRPAAGPAAAGLGSFHG